MAALESTTVVSGWKCYSTPEDKGAESLLGPLSDIPAYPDKVRPLSHFLGSLRIAENALNNKHQKLAEMQNLLSRLKGRKDEEVPT